MAYRRTKHRLDTQPQVSAQEQLPNRQHERFAQLVATERNVTEAYAEVYPGSSRDAARANGARLIAIDNIRRRAEHLSAAILKKAITAAAVTKERVLTELARISFAKMADYIAIGPDGQPRIDVSVLTDAHWAAIAEVTFDTIGAPDLADGKLRQVIRTKIKLLPKLPALEQLCRHLQLFSGTVEEGPAANAKQEEQREKNHRLMMALLKAREQGRLPPELEAALDSWAGVPDSEA